MADSRIMITTKITPECNKTEDKDDIIVRNVIWRAWGQRDYSRNKEFIDFDLLQIDHIIPDSFDKTKPENLTYLKRLGLNEDFNLNSILNYGPTTGSWNRDKSNMLFPDCLAAFLLDEARRLAPGIVKEIKKLRSKGITAAEISNTVEKISKDNLVKKTFIEMCSQLANFEIIDKVEEIGDTNIYQFSDGNVNLVAYIPSSSKYNCSIYIDFATMQIDNSVICIEGVQLINNLFKGAGTGVNNYNRAYVNSYIDTEDMYGITLGSLYLMITENTLKEFNKGIDELYKHYLNGLRKYELARNSLKFYYSKHYGYKLFKVTRDFWLNIYKYTLKHDGYSSENEDACFEPNMYMLKIYTSRHPVYGNGYHAILHLERGDDYFFKEEYWLCWDGIELYNSEDYSINGEWSMDFTYNWIIANLIPKVAYDITKASNKTSFLSFASFMKNYNISEWISTYECKQIDINGYTFEKVFNAIDILQLHYSLSFNVFISKNNLMSLWYALNIIITDSTLTIGCLGDICRELEFAKITNKSELLDIIDKKAKAELDGMIYSFKINAIFRALLICLQRDKENLIKYDFSRVMSHLVYYIDDYNNKQLLEKAKAY